MKLIGIITFILFTFCAVQAKPTVVPKQVKDAFAKLHPGAKHVTWEKEGANEFEVGFKENGVGISVVIDTTGTLVETETDIPTASLPAAIAPYLAKEFAGFTLKAAAKIERADGTVTFETELLKGKKEKTVMFDKEGAPLKKPASK